MQRSLSVGLLVGLLSLTVTGCGQRESQNIMEGADKSAIEEYEAMIEAGNAAMSAQDDSATP